jgi:hypothetical protein
MEDLKKEKEAFAAQALEFKSKYDELDTSVKSKAAKEREDAEWNKAYSALQFREDVSPLMKKGFDSEVREKYKLEFGDDGTRKVLGKDGQILMDKKRAQTFASLEDLLKAEAEAAKLIGGAPAGGTPVRKTINTTAAGLSGQTAPQTAPRPSGPGARPQRTVMPR